MYQFEQWTRRIFISGVVLWTIAALFRLLPFSLLYLILGGLVVFLGIKNALLVYLGVQQGQPPAKLTTLVDKYGSRKGAILYMVFFVGIYLLIGLLFLFAGFTT